MIQDNQEKYSTSNEELTLTNRQGHFKTSKYLNIKTFRQIAITRVGYPNI